MSLIFYSEIIKDQRLFSRNQLGFGPWSKRVFQHCQLIQPDIPYDKVQ